MTAGMAPILIPRAMGRERTMPTAPWSKFYWSDWRSDPRLRMCGLAARGLWIEMLALMHEADPYGHLLVHGRPPTDTQLAVLVGAPPSTIPELLGELRLAGVFSQGAKGVIYSRRMTRDAKKSRVAVKNGASGGNPNIRLGTVPKSQRVRPFRRSDNPAMTRRIFERDGGRCHWCGVELAWGDSGLAPNTFHVDHVIAVCDGGTNVESNLVAACASCNHGRAREGPPDIQSGVNVGPQPDVNTQRPEARGQKPEVGGRGGEVSGESRARASRTATTWQEDGEVPAEWIEAARRERRRCRLAEANLDRAAATFVTHALGNARTSFHWRADFIRWALREEADDDKRKQPDGPATALMRAAGRALAKLDQQEADRGAGDGAPEPLLDGGRT